jgi:hypothetical protein
VLTKLLFVSPHSLTCVGAFAAAAAWGNMLASTSVTCSKGGSTHDSKKASKHAKEVNMLSTVTVALSLPFGQATVERHKRGIICIT